MATYYPNSSNERDLYPAIYQRILGQESYADSSFPNNMMYLNYPSSGTFPDPSAECSRGQHNLELPMASNLLSQESSACASEMASSHDGNSFVNAFREGKSLMIPSIIAPAAPGADHQMDCHNMAFPASNVHGLSLSLGRHHQIQSFHYHASNADISYLGSRHSPARSGLHSRERTVYYEPDSPFPVLNSKYLKAAQELLDEVVNVRGALIQKREKAHSGGAQKDNDVNFKSNKMHLSAGVSAPNSVSDLSLAERQEIQSKMTKLLNMLDEVDRRYKHYYHQMQGIVAPFDRIAGPDTAKPYTRLALETISRHFRSLRDAIDGQIRIMSMNHGDLEHPCNGDRGNGGIERLRFVDQKLRQERSFQQHAWRLQRGLPENSVSILRAWLFEHFLHPYPKDSDKMLLARQTGLTRNQVSNWFINARVRLWKPMVEEMYKEELGGGGGGGGNDGDVDSNSDDDGGGKSPSLISPMEVLLPPYEMSRSPDESAVAAIRQAIISADGGSGGVSLTLGLHQGDRRRSAAGDVVARVNGGGGGYDVSNIEPCMDYEGLHLPGKQRKIGSSLLRDFAV